MKRNAAGGPQSLSVKSYRKTRIRKIMDGHSPSRSSDQKSFALYCGEWLSLSQNRVKRSTYVKYHNIIVQYLQPELGEYLPGELTTIRVEDFTRKLLQQLSVKTVRDILTVLQSVLRYSCRQEGVPETEIIYPKMERKEMRILTPEEQKTFIQYLLTDMDEIKFGVLLALLTGLRIGEICALRWNDILMEESAIHVRFTVQRLQTLSPNSRQKTQVVFSDAKTKTSDRIIPLSGCAFSLCRMLRPLDGEAFVLTGSPDRWMEPRSLQNRLKKYTSSCGLNGIHFHTLRHTFATRCVEVGFEIKTLSEILGHSSAKITLDRYVHPSLELKRANMEKLTTIGL